MILLSQNISEPATFYHKRESVNLLSKLECWCLVVVVLVFFFLGCCCVFVFFSRKHNLCQLSLVKSQPQVSEAVIFFSGLSGSWICVL